MTTVDTEVHELKLLCVPLCPLRLKIQSQALCPLWPLWLKILPDPTVDHALNSIPKMSDVEIHKQPNVDTAQSHIGEKLGLVNRMNRFNALHFDND